MKYNSTTTLRRIREGSPESGRACDAGWKNLLKTLGKSKADDEPISLLTVLDSNGLDDALWVLSFAMPDDKLARHFQGWCADQVLHIFEAKYPGDTRVRDQIAMLRNDNATREERAASRAAARGSWSAAWGSSVWAAARGAAYTGARSAARASASWDAARDAQELQLRKMIGETI